MNKEKNFSSECRLWVCFLVLESTGKQMAQATLPEGIQNEEAEMTANQLKDDHSPYATAASSAVAVASRTKPQAVAVEKLPDIAAASASHAEPKPAICVRCNDALAMSMLDSAFGG